MEFILIFFFSVVVPLLMTGLVGYKKAYLPFKDGKLKIDKLKNPTLYRIQRHLYVSNTEQREIEADEKRKAIEWRRTVETKSITEHSAELIEIKRDKHNKELWKFDTEFQEITRERDEQARRELEAQQAKERAAQRALEAAERDRQLALWTEQEKIRIARFKAEQELLQKAEYDRQMAQQQEIWANIAAQNEYRDPSAPQYAQRYVAVHGLYVRSLPMKDSRMLGNLKTSTQVTVDGWIEHETVYGNPIWYRLSNGKGWVWSGGLNSHHTSMLEDLNYLKTPGDSWEMRDFTGRVYQSHAEPSELEKMIRDDRQPGRYITAGVITAAKINVNVLTSGEDHDFFTPIEKKQRKSLAGMKRDMDWSEFLDD